jgi:transketolase
MAPERLMRDVVVDAVYEAACRDRDVFFLAADLGAAALDRFRADLPGQFIHTGISEQHMIDLAAGLALSGKRVFCYAMASFITARCYEQIKCALAAMRLPVTLIAVGVGCGYDDAGPTHYTLEDVACLRALAGIEIHSPADAEATAAIVRLALERPALRVLRLERPALPAVYGGGFAAVLADGLAEVVAGEDVCLVSSGYLLHRALAARARLLQDGIAAGVVDLFRVKPLDPATLARVLERYRAVVTLEEQFLPGGLGGAVLEACADAGLLVPVRRLGLPERYPFENGGREHLLTRAGLAIEDVARAVREMARRPAAVA